MQEMIITGKQAVEFQKEIDENTAKHQNGKVNKVKLNQVRELIKRSNETT